MDPEACLQLATSALAGKNIPGAVDALCNYIDWRSHDGFEPVDGDVRAYALIHQVHGVTITRMDLAVRGKFLKAAKCEQS